MNTEAILTVSVTGDSKLVGSLEDLLQGIKFKVLERDVAIRFGSAALPDSILVVYIHYNLSIGQLREICKEKSSMIGHLINVVPEDDAGEKRNATKTAALQVAHSLNYFCRYGPLSGLTKKILEEDILNSLNLAMAPEPADEKAFNIKRYLDFMVYTDEISLAVARETLCRKQEADVHGVIQLYPIGLNKFAIDKKAFYHLSDLSKEQNHMWVKMATDLDYLIDHCEKVAKGEPFLQNLIEIAKKVSVSKTAQTAKLCYARNDFSSDTNGQFLQIEPNMWAAGYGPMQDRFERALKHIESICTSVYPNKRAIETSSDTEACLVGGLEAAWKHYGVQDAIIVMVSSPHFNAFDMFASAKRLAEKKITLKRYFFDEILDLMEYDEETGIFKVQGQEVAVFYYRDGYLPEHYTPETWKVREKMELSRAVKAPNISYQLANTKYMQHIMGKKDHWLRFGYSEETFKEHSKFFPDSYCLADFDNSIEKFSAFIEENGGYSSWVYKPQRDGGGASNLIDDDIKEFLSTATPEEAANFILQKRIKVVERTGIQTNWNRTAVRPVGDELGFYHCIFSDKNDIIFEKAGGCVNWTTFADTFLHGDSDYDFCTSSGILLVE